MKYKVTSRKESLFSFWMFWWQEALTVPLVEVVPVKELHPYHHQKLGKHLQDIPGTSKDERTVLGVHSSSSDPGAFLLFYSGGGSYPSCQNHTLNWSQDQMQQHHPAYVAKMISSTCTHGILRHNLEVYTPGPCIWVGFPYVPSFACAVAGE